MKTAGILIFSLGLGLLYTETGMSSPETQATAKAKIRVAEETVTKDCYKVPDSGRFAYEGKIKALKSTPQSSLNNQCNTTYTDCKGSCFTSPNKSEKSSKSLQKKKQ